MAYEILLDSTSISKRSPSVTVTLNGWDLDGVDYGSRVIDTVLRASAFYIKVYLIGGKEAMTFDLSDVQNQPSWTNNTRGAQQAVREISAIVGIPNPSGGGGITELTGPVTAGPGSGSVATTITPTGVAAGTYTYATVDVGADGRITSASSGAPPTGTVTSVTASSPLSSSGGPTPNIAASTSTGGNGATDSGKLLVFGAQGQIEGSSSNLAAVTGTASGNAPGVAGETASATAPGVQGYAPNGGPGVLGQADGGAGVESQSNTGAAFRGSTDTGAGVHVNVTDATNAADLALFHRDDNLGVEIRNDGELDWTTATGAQGTATNLPVFGTATKGVVPASGGGTTNFLRADGTFAATPSPTGAALTRTDDTNVTLTLGGTPATALLQATSITAGWTGTLAITRGGTGGGTISAAHTNLEIYNSTRVLLNQATTMTNQPNSLEILTSANPGLFISRVDLTNFTQVMLQVHVFTASGSVNTPRVILGYSTTYTTTAGSYSDIGTTAVTCSMSSAGIIQSGWVNLAAGAKADIYITGLTAGGNGSADPVIQGVTAFFR